MLLRMSEAAWHDVDLGGAQRGDVVVRGIDVSELQKPPWLMTVSPEMVVPGKEEELMVSVPDPTLVNELLEICPVIVMLKFWVSMAAARCPRCCGRWVM